MRARSSLAGWRVCLCVLAALAVTLGVDPAVVARATPAQSAQDSLAYLRGVMDQFHSRFPVYDDVSSAGNHFHAYARIPFANAPVTMNGSSTTLPHSGATAIRCELTGQSSGGFYLQNGVLAATDSSPQPNFGTVPNAGIDLTGATTLTFWARGQTGGERIEFFVAGVGRDPASGIPTMSFPDSSPRRPALGEYTTLTTAWQQFSIDLTGMDLSSVLGGFGWFSSAALNPVGTVFFLDDIQYELSPPRREQRLNEPRLLNSFATAPVQPNVTDGNLDDDIDLVLRNAAFTYDNALALLAFLADGTVDGLRRARLIGDAFIYASQHDKYFSDNRACGSALPIDAVNGARMRTAYAAGDIALPNGWTPNGRVATVPIAGYYTEAPPTFTEVEQQSIDTGNNAWTMLALLALFERTQQASYLDTACKLGQFVRTFRAAAGSYQGFLAGVDSPQSASPVARVYARTQHNLDLAAAFDKLSRLSGNSTWAADAQHARTFVEAMWDAPRGCYLAGTTNANTRNANALQLPLDAQAWSVLALTLSSGRMAQVMTCAETNHRTARNGFTGFDFNNDRDGIWFEGTGQMAVAYAAAGQFASADTVRQELQRAQQTPPFGSGGALAASEADGLTTGFGFKYFRRLHVAATAWNVFAQLAFNPFKDIGVNAVEPPAEPPSPPPTSPPPPLPPPPPSVPAPPVLHSVVAGLSVTLSWTPSSGATSYQLEAGSAPGQSDVYVANLGLATQLQAVAPPGTYYVRVRPVGGAGIRAPSTEVTLTLPGCTAPSVPTALASSVTGSTVVLTWALAHGATVYILEAGTLPGVANVFNGNVGSSPVLVATAPPNTYYVRLRSVGDCGVSGPSETISLTVP